MANGKDTESDMRTYTTLTLYNLVPASHLRCRGQEEGINKLQAFLSTF